MTACAGFVAPESAGYAGKVVYESTAVPINR